MRATEATNYNSRRTVNGILDTGSTPVYSIQENAQKQRVSGIFFISIGNCFDWKRIVYACFFLSSAIAP